MGDQSPNDASWSLAGGAPLTADAAPEGNGISASEITQPRFVAPGRHHRRSLVHTGEWDAEEGGTAVLPIARRALILAVALALSLIPGTALAASKPIAQFHDHFTDSFSTELCEIEVDVVIVVTDNFFVYADDSFTDIVSVKQTFTNPDTGESVVISVAGPAIGSAALIDEEAGTITFENTFIGLPEKIQTPHGPVLLRDAGIITFRNTFDLETGEFLDSETLVNLGPHPDAESDFELFCQTIVAALT